METMIKLLLCQLPRVSVRRRPQGYRPIIFSTSYGQKTFQQRQDTLEALPFIRTPAANIALAAFRLRSLLSGNIALPLDPHHAILNFESQDFSSPRKPRPIRLCGIANRLGVLNYEFALTRVRPSRSTTTSREKRFYP